jgi:hypothetical protein
MVNVASVTHANRHASGGADPVTPASIGAATAAALTAEIARATGAEAAIGAPATLIPTAVKAANYTAAVGDNVLVDATAATRTITLPTAPADKSRIGVHMVAVDLSGAHNVVIACGGTDVFDVAGGFTTDTLDTLNQSVVYQYVAATHIWNTNNASVDFDALAPVATSGDAGDLTAGILNLERAPAGTAIFVIWDTTSSTWQFNGVTVTSRMTSRTDIHIIFWGNTAAASWGLNGVDAWMSA